MKEEKNNTESVVVAEADTTKKTRYHSEIEETLIKDILKVDLKESAQELDKRVVVQHVDNRTNIECFNATAKNVLIRDENGDRILINNHEEIRKQKLKNAGKLNQPVVENISKDTTITTIDEDVEFDD